MCRQLDRCPGRISNTNSYSIGEGSVKLRLFPSDAGCWERLTFKNKGVNIIFIERIAILPAYLILFSPF
jgi:hypothetical protein